MKRLLMVAAVLVGINYGAMADDIRLPTAPTPVQKPDAIQTLSQDQLYVIDSDVPLTVLASPQGIVSISADTGPVKVRAKFTDKLETQTFKGKFVYMIEAQTTGNVEILIVAQDNRVIRRSLKVGVPDPPKPTPTTFGDKLKTLAKGADPGSLSKLTTILDEVAGQDYQNFDQMESVLVATAKKYLPNGELQPLRDAISAEIVKRCGDDSRKRDVDKVKSVYKDAVAALKG